MRETIRKRLRDFIALLVLVAVALGVGSFVLAHQRFYLPSWVPLIGSDFVDLKAEFQTAQSLTPGQGQAVTIAGVPVGQISNVDLVNGRAVVTMKLKPKYAERVKSDATMLLRPKTGLNDMVVELNPGSSNAGKLPRGEMLPVSQTLPNVNSDEVLSALDEDTRNYLKLLLNGAGGGLRGQGRTLSATLRRFDPTTRDLAKISNELVLRRKNLTRVVHNFQLLATALGSKDRQLASFVSSSDAVFNSFAKQEANLRKALALLPDTLDQTATALTKTDRLARQLGPALAALRPGARALGPSLQATRPFLTATTPVIRDRLRPFTRTARPAVRELTPAAKNLSELAPKLTKSLKVLNLALNTLAYNPSGSSNEGYLFWVAWANHSGASVFSLQDAHGTYRRAATLVSCAAMGAVQLITKGSASLNTIVHLTNLPSEKEACDAVGQPTSSGGLASATTPAGGATP